MKIFVTGATGFIGSQVANILSCQGHELVCLVRNQNEKSKVLANLGATLVLGDITDKKSIMEGMKGCDVAIHLAAIYSFWIRNIQDYRLVNVEGTRNVMECALENKLKKIIHVSSVVSFGKPADQPFNERSKPGAVMFSRYALTKYEGDQIVWDLHKRKGLPVVVVYPGGVLGAGDPKSSGTYIYDFIHKRMPGTVLNKSVLTWVHVNDVADGIVKALVKNDNIGEKYVLAKHYVSMADFNKMISDVSGVPVPKMSMPDFMTYAGAGLLTLLSRITGKQPPLGMSIDQIRTMREGFIADGSKAERELGLEYTPMRKAIEEEVSVALGDYMQKTKKNLLESGLPSLH